MHDRIRTGWYLGRVDSMSIVIIEGPDGAGKSTLLRRLLEKYPEYQQAPRACSSLGGPLRGDALIAWLEGYGIMDGYVYDRHPCISGPVYNAVYADLPDRRTWPRLQGAMHEIHENARVIYCRPPRREIVKSVNESTQMGGIDRKICRIIDTYDAIMASMIPHERYDWTQDGLPNL